jgi:hypothetical protein
VIRAWYLALCIVAIATLVGADEPPKCSPVGVGPDWQPRKGWLFFPRGGFGNTPGFFASGTAIVGHLSARCQRCALGAGASGFLLQGGLGTRSARASAGFASLFAFGGWAAKLSLERTWSKSGATQPGALFSGPEIQLMLSPVSVSTGVMFHVGGTFSSTVRWTWSAGVGF